MRNFGLAALASLFAGLGAALSNNAGHLPSRGVETQRREKRDRNRMKRLRLRGPAGVSGDKLARKAAKGQIGAHGRIR